MVPRAHNMVCDNDAKSHKDCVPHIIRFVVLAVLHDQAAASWSRSSDTAGAVNLRDEGEVCWSRGSSGMQTVVYRVV